ncbi:MAG: hypothetical protein NTV46_03535 [Verrucomicrobia bacterium]|nr:hypothetical protein [Verrucomicrobiota bacterium]
MKITPTAAPSGTQNEFRPERKSHSWHEDHIDDFFDRMLENRVLLKGVI